MLINVNLQLSNQFHLTFVQKYAMFKNVEQGVKMNKHDLKLDPKRELIEKALAALWQETGLKANIQDMNAEVDQHYDAEVNIKTSDLLYRYFVDVRPSITISVIEHLARRQKESADRVIVITREIEKNTADLLKTLNIQYLDTLGNAYIQQGSMIVYIVSTQAVVPRIQTKRFRTGELRVVFALLSVPELIAKPFRKIAQLTDVSLGTVSSTIEKFKEKGDFMPSGNRPRRLINKEKLLNEWVDAYGDSLREKMLSGRYASDDIERLMGASLVRYNAVWGGEVAATKLTSYLKPEIITIYCESFPSKLILDYRLKKRNTGNIEIRKTFWHFNTDNIPILTPLILTYADLMATNDARNLETARIIYDEHIRRLIEKD